MAKKILIMDDDPTIADLLAEALAYEGYETFMTTQSLRNRLSRGRQRGSGISSVGCRAYRIQAV